MTLRLFIVFLLLASFTKAQESSLEFNTDFGLINNHLSQKLIIESNGFLDDAKKNNIISALNAVNYLHLGVNNGLKYQNKSGWSLGFENHLEAYATYSEDFIKLTLLGNAPFKGETLHLEPLGISAYHYSEIEVGYQWNTKLNTSISLLAGHHFVDLLVNKATFYTDEFTDFFEYDLAFEGHFSDTTDLQNNLFAVNGKGAALNAQYTDSIENIRYNLFVKDFGMIKWNEKTTNTLVESQWKFEGVNIDDFIAFNDSILENYFDSIQGIFQKNNQESYTWQLPVTFGLNLFQSINAKVIDAYSFSLEHKPRFYDYPRFGVDVHKNLRKHTFSLGYFYGGYEKPGFQFAYNFKGKRTQFKLFTKSASSIVPSQNYGVHLGIGIKRVFSASK